MKLVQALSIKTLSQKEETSMEELNRASEILEQLKDIRILYLPPMTVASCQSTGDNQEEVVGTAISTFIKESGLVELKPDFRRIGFNNPASEQSGGSLGYEAWVSIPGDMEVPAPLVKKQFEVDFSPRTDPADPSADPSLEEQLNAIHHLEDTSPFGTQLDLLVPIKPKRSQESENGEISVTDRQGWPSDSNGNTL